MEVEFYGKYDCVNPQPLGMEDGSIGDGQLTASSYLTVARHAIASRLNSGSWRQASGDTNPWLQVDLLHQTKITGVATQGHRDNPSLIKTFKMSTGNDGKNFASYTESALVKIFQSYIPGNTNGNTVVKQTFAKIIVARFIRIYPLQFQYNPCLRIEVYGSPIVTTSCLYPQALGLENYVIRDAQLTSSSEKDETSRAMNARQNFNGTAGAWIALGTDMHPWLRVDFIGNVTLTAVATQGRNDADEWVTSFKLSFSMDSSNYEYYEENDVPKVFQANTDRNTTVKHYMFPAVFTRYVRLHPKTWHSACAMRTEFFGCYEGMESVAVKLS
ncbi:lactadherin-like [Dendronephthya gigantea]|uniref:lactadherin-like n=1 Tax=Dendronephthya gigantea TaxID=151771 RepID=UPI00106CB0BE|nr:lactadherin-like [Dendronephthya gigantea]